MIGSWVREYAVQLEYQAPANGLQSLLSTTDAAAVTFAATKVGVCGDTTSTGLFKLLLNNKPDIPATTSIKEVDVADGISDNSEEDIQSTIAEPSPFNPQLNVNTYLASLFCSLLFQNGFGETANGSVNTGICVPYITPDILRYGAFAGIVQRLATAGAPSTRVVDQNELIRGALPSSVKFAAKESELLTLDVNILAASWQNQFALPAVYSSTTGKQIKVPFLKWQNAKIILQNAYVVQTDPTQGLATYVDSTNTQVNSDGFDLTVTNGLSAKFYNATNVAAFVLGQLRAEGNIIIPWVVPGLGNLGQYYWQQISDFRNGYVKRLTIYWGSSKDDTSENAMSIDMYIKYKTGVLDGDVLGSNMAFICVEPVAGTPSLVLKFNYNNSGARSTTRLITS